MKKILFFPLLRSMPSGHHQVADAISELISAETTDIVCKKVDLLSEWNILTEYISVYLYLKWIRMSPGSYAWVYRKFAYQQDQNHSFLLYNMMFLWKVKRILKAEQPDLIVCTHGFPSLFINKLKKEGKCTIPCLNIYTDFFINDVWGKSHIDYHFVPNESIKTNLQNDFHIPASRILVTGIPVSRKFGKAETKKEDDGRVSILVSGGSAGLGGILEIIEAAKDNLNLRFFILCGTNRKLFKQIKRKNLPNVTPYAYVASKEEMNRLYSESDAIVTKPGGVTVSEALKKEVPIFVHSPLPGQEEINLQLLTARGLVFRIPINGNLPAFVWGTLHDEKEMQAYRDAVARYKQSLALSDPEDLVQWIEGVLKSG